MKVELSGVSETLLIPLWARAAEGKRPDPIFTDTKAAEIVAGVDYDFSKFETAWKSQVGVAVRTKLFDDAVYEFQSRNPDGVVVNLGAGLDTRPVRIRLGDMTWYDLDLPESMGLRRRFFSESDRCRFLSKSILDLSWMDEVERDGKPVLLI
ncbi:MAG: class I SAM-dependent methyltransferase, partial [Rhodospirillales bacterium]|nr:class I SAM-dependent methyltransferase [Rhodospirillales bacterium]